ncbi:hypothetical protein GKC30_06005 [Pseudodesulfovibrio sp. F-1]|uniref:Uncharacterized protein n=1 Tax=Pseudodesulfovibrio alkaliphilus TaxID=2661613 RepID=A0A7K1KMT7_9BACT|nr:hypothetical protein [Pseudodesulfovibrio alkaliphilus]MUM77182.1 hypothetical protein [Pseudodesulfovibrio alkaliphilus]
MHIDFTSLRQARIWTMGYSAPEFGDLHVSTETADMAQMVENSEGQFQVSARLKPPERDFIR